jgi:hypothetical protein
MPGGLRHGPHMTDAATMLQSLLTRSDRVIRPPFAQVLPGGYEPERHLFGADSGAWPAFHRPDPRPPAWAYPLALLRHVLDGLGVFGWENLDVWDRILRRTGRTVPDGMTAATVAAAADGVRALGADTGRPGTRPLFTAALSDRAAGP